MFTEIWYTSQLLSITATSKILSQKRLFVSLVKLIKDKIMIKVLVRMGGNSRKCRFKGSKEKFTWKGFCFALYILPKMKTIGTNLRYFQYKVLLHFWKNHRSTCSLNVVLSSLMGTTEEILE